MLTVPQYITVCCSRVMVFCLIFNPFINVSLCLFRMERECLVLTSELDFMVRSLATWMSKSLCTKSLPSQSWLKSLTG